MEIDLVQEGTAAPGTGSGLPVWKSVAIAYETVVRSPGLLFGRAWFWVIVACPVSGTASWLAGTHRVPWFGLFGAVAPVAAMAAFAVAWHRTILLDERTMGLAGIRFGWREIRFLFVGFVVAVVVYVPTLMLLLVLGLAVSAVGADHTPSASLPIADVLAAVTTFAIIAARLSLAFPLLALDSTRATLGDAWELSRGHGIGLFGGATMAVAPFFALQWGLDRLLEPGEIHANRLALDAALGAATTLIAFVQTAVLVGFVSHAYGRLAGHMPPERHPETTGYRSPEGRRGANREASRDDWTPADGSPALQRAPIAAAVDQ